MNPNEIPKRNAFADSPIDLGIDKEEILPDGIDTEMRQGAEIG